MYAITVQSCLSVAKTSCSIKYLNARTPTYTTSIFKTEALCYLCASVINDYVLLCVYKITMLVGLGLLQFTSCISTKIRFPKDLYA